MKIMQQMIQFCLIISMLLVLNSVVHGQDYSYTNNGDDTATLTGYNGSDDVVNIPSTIDGLTVISIGYGAFEYRTNVNCVTIPNSVTNIGEIAFADCWSLTNVTIPGSITGIGFWAFVECQQLPSVTIPGSVTSIGPDAFGECFNLTNINVDVQNSVFSSVNGVLFDNARTTLLQFPGGVQGRYRVPGIVTSIGYEAFDGTSLASVTLPASVTNISDYAFVDATNLTGIYFIGNAPTFGSYVFLGSNPTLYYLPNTVGWDTVPSPPAVLWNPQVQNDANFGIQSNQFGFDIAGAKGMVVVVEACTNLSNPIWSSVATNTFTGDSSHFSDPQWLSYPTRFYSFNLP